MKFAHPIVFGRGFWIGPFETLEDARCAEVKLAKEPMVGEEAKPLLAFARFVLEVDRGGLASHARAVLKAYGEPE